MGLHDKVDFLRSSALPRMADATFPYVASVFGVLDHSQGVHEGSGLRCLLSGRRCLVTALHVLEAARKKYPLGIAVSAGYGIRPFLIQGEVHFDRRADLAIYYLPEDYPGESQSLQYWPEDRIERTTLSRNTDYLFVHGFPCKLSDPVSWGIANRSFPYGAMEMIESEGLPTTLGQNQFGIHFSSAGMPLPIPEWVSEPTGLSGSPVWRLGLSGGSLATWNPDDCRLVGIVIEHWNGPELNGKDFLVATETTRLFEINPLPRISASLSPP